MPFDWSLAEEEEKKMEEQVAAPTKKKTNPFAKKSQKSDAPSDSQFDSYAKLHEKVVEEVMSECERDDGMGNAGKSKEGLSEGHAKQTTLQGFFIKKTEEKKDISRSSSVFGDVLAADRVRFAILSFPCYMSSPLRRAL